LQIGLPESHDFYVKHGNPFLSQFPHSKHLCINHQDILIHEEKLIALLQLCFQHNDSVVYASQLGSYSSVFLHLVKSVLFAGSVITSTSAPIGYWRDLWSMLNLPSRIKLPTPCVLFLQSLSFSFCSEEIHITFKPNSGFHRWVSKSNCHWFGTATSVVKEWLEKGNVRSFDFGEFYKQVVMFEDVFVSQIHVDELEFDDIFASLIISQPCHRMRKDSVLQDVQHIHVGTVVLDASTPTTSKLSLAKGSAVLPSLYSE
jgi:hypothetical protein